MLAGCIIVVVATRFLGFFRRSAPWRLKRPTLLFIGAPVSLSLSLRLSSLREQEAALGTHLWTHVRIQILIRTI